MTTYNKGWKKSKELIPQCTPIRNIEVDWKLYKQLLSYRTHSLDEIAQEEFTRFLIDHIHNWNMDIEMEIDKAGNLYITKGIGPLYPCIVAHQDINQDEEVTDIEIIQTSKLIIGLDKDTGKQCGLGHDDKAGLYFLLHCLKTMDNIKGLITTNEEIGAVGASEVDMLFFKDCSFLIQGDRNIKKGLDVSDYTNGIEVVSLDFERYSKQILDKYGYKYTTCLFTDIGELVHQGCGISAINFGIGYGNEHFEDEYLSIPHFINALAFGEDLINHMRHKKWKHSPYIKQYKSKKQKNHYVPGWKFTEGDKRYIEDSLAIGECPMCMSNKFTEMYNGAKECEHCGAIWNIPEEITDFEELLY